MSAYQPKKVSYKPKDQADDLPVKSKLSYKSKDDGQKLVSKSHVESNAFGFRYDQGEINYRTKIQPLPEKNLPRPDEKHKNKKLKDLNQKIDALKQERRKKKDQYKNSQRSYENQISQLKQKIYLGKRCSKVLDYDIKNFQSKIQQLRKKIRRQKKELDDINSNIRSIKQQSKSKNIQQMTNQQLDEKVRAIQQIMSRKNLSKKQETQKNNQIIKLKKIKLDNTRVIATSKDSQLKDLQHNYSLISKRYQKLIEEKSQIQRTVQNIKLKINTIDEDVQNFISEIKHYAELEQNDQSTNQLREQTKLLKDQIYKAREQKQIFEKQFEQKLKAYQMEQQKIKWINWAINVQERKKEEWQKEKQERKRQKLRLQKGQKKQQSSINQESKQQQRKKINKNQKQIDICSFLIGYCKQLYPNSIKIQTQQTKDSNLSEQLKKGAWAKEKGLQVIESKKNKKDEEENPKYNKKKEAKEQKTEEIPSNRLSHSYFNATTFDNVKVLPPATIEELDKTIKHLQDKIDYYMAHPDGEKANTENKKYKSNDDYKEVKGKNKKIINTQDFPAII